MIEEIKMERINGNKNALSHSSVRCAKKMVESAMHAIENGNYSDMMTYIRLAKLFEENVFIVKGE